MARNVVKRDAVEQHTDAVPTKHMAPMEGGTSGAPDEPMVQQYGGPKIAPAHPAPVHDGPARRHYRVTSSRGSVMYDGQRVGVPVGKIFPEHSVDLDRLRGQGVVLVEVDAAGAEVQQAS